MDSPISKATALPAMSLGITIAAVVVIFFGGRDLGRWKAEQEAEHKEVVNRVADLEGRFNMHTGTRGKNTTDIAKLNALLLSLEKELSVLHGKEVGR